MLKRTLRACALSAALLSGCQDGDAVAPSAKAATPTSPTPTAPVAAAAAPTGSTAPVAQLPVKAGMPGLMASGLLRLATQQRRGLLVALWASWCGSCRMELPLLKEMMSGFEDQGVGLVLLSLDEDADLPKARALLDEIAIDADAYYYAGRIGVFKQHIAPGWKGALPSTMLLDAEGETRHFWQGPALPTEIAPILQRFLAGEVVDGFTNLAALPDDE